MLPVRERVERSHRRGSVTRSTLYRISMLADAPDQNVLAHKCLNVLQRGLCDCGANTGLQRSQQATAMQSRNDNSWHSSNICLPDDADGCGLFVALCGFRCDVSTPRVARVADRETTINVAKEEDAHAHDCGLTACQLCTADLGFRTWFTDWVYSMRTNFLYCIYK